MAPAQVRITARVPVDLGQQGLFPRVEARDHPRVHSLSEWVDCASAMGSKVRDSSMKATGLLVLWFLLLGTSGEVIAAPCSSYYISEITLVSPGDTQAGPVHTFVGFGASKEEAEKNALGSCSHIKLDLQTCLDSDRLAGRNDPSDKTNNSLHLKYAKAAKRITSCD